MFVANEYVGDVTIPTQVIMYNQCCSRQISQSDCSIHIKLNYLHISFQKSPFNMRLQNLANLPTNSMYRSTYRAHSVAVHRAK